MTRWKTGVFRLGRDYRVVLLMCVALLLPACGLGELADLLPWSGSGTSAPASGVVSQWAVTATASSAYGRPDWSPNRATGAPDVPACSDDARAWASARGNGVEWLELGYSQPVYATEVRVHQSFGRGAVSRITLIDVEANAWLVWEGRDVETQCPGVLVARMEPTTEKIAKVRIDLDESRTGFWNQIDAVELIGSP
jgi:hypothetical protein